MIQSMFRKKEGKEKAEGGAVEEQRGQLSPSAAIPQEMPADPGPSMHGRNPKLPLDKKSLDLIAAVEHVVQARQLADTQMEELQERLKQSMDMGERLQKDIRGMKGLIEEKEQQIQELEQKLLDKNLRMDQMLEDYRELQTEMSAKTEELGNRIELEQQKYVQLLQKHNEDSLDKVNRIHELEDRIRKLEVENNHLKQKNEAARKENSYLLGMIQDFTNRMSTTFVQFKQDGSDVLEDKPGR